MDPLDTCPIPGRRDTSKAARRRIRLAICAEKWADGVDPTTYHAHLGHHL